MTKTADRLSPDTIYIILRNRICALEYLPGQRLREAELADEFGISRTPIRAILQKLSHGGLIESRDGVGTIVTELSKSELVDIYEMRMKLAAMIGEMNPGTLTENLSQSIEALLARMPSLIAKFDMEDYWAINHELHCLIVSIIGNSALRQMWNHYYYLAARMWYQKAEQNPEDSAELLYAEIKEVARAIKEKNPLALGYAQRTYIAYGLSRLQKHDL